MKPKIINYFKTTSIMKGILKLFPAALAVIALASCSNDDILGEKAQAPTPQKGDLVISFDGFDDEGSNTRALRDNAFGTLTFQEDDQVNVYDDQLYATDFYTFQTDAFYFEEQFEGDTKQVTEPKFAVIPGDKVKKAYVYRQKNENRVDIEIPQVITYKEEAINATTTGYGFDLPAFGYAKLNSEGYVEVSKLRYMVGILKIDLKNAFSNATYLKLSNAAGKPLSGNLTAILTSDESKRKEVKLQVLDSELKVNSDIYVDLRTVPSNQSCVYIPIVPGLDGDADGIKLEYAKDDVADPTTIGTWTATGMKFPGTTFEQNKRYTGEHEFALADLTPNLVTSMLEQYKSTSSDIVLDVTNSFTVGSETSTEGRLIQLPKFENDVNVEINLASTFATWSNSTGYRIDFVDADSEEPFTGKVTLNVANKLPASSKTPLYINLPEADVVIAGDFDKANNNGLTVVAAKSFSIGDGKTNTSVVEGSLNLTDGTTAGNISSDVKKFVVAANARLKMTTATKIATVGNTDVTIDGSLLATSIDMTASPKSTLTIGGRKADATATPAITALAAYIQGNVKTAGDVVVNLTAEGEVLQGGSKALTMSGANKTLTLVQGYLEKVVAHVANTGQWEGNAVTIVLDNAKEGRAMILNMEEENGDNGKPSKIAFNKSLWDGNAITNTFTNYYGKYTTYKYYDAEGTLRTATDAILTATQMASVNYYNGGNGVKLFNDLDLNNKVWSKVAGNAGYLGKFDGQNHTIEKLNIGGNSGSLFFNGSSNSEVKNLKIVGVTSAAAPTSKLGALIADVTLATTIENVEVSGIAIASTGALNIAGGLIGNVAANLTLKKVSATGSIDGYTNLGGIIGKVTSGAVTIDKDSKAAVTIAQSYASGKKMDANYASIGGIAGSVTTGSGTSLTIDAGVTATAPTHAHKAQEYISDVDATSGNFFDINIDTTVNPYVGFNGTANSSKTAGKSLNVKVGSTTFYEPAFGFDNAKTVDSKGVVTATYNGGTEKVGYYFSKQD